MERAVEPQAKASPEEIEKANRGVDVYLECRPVNAHIAEVLRRIDARWTISMLGMWANVADNVARRWSPPVGTCLVCRGEGFRLEPGKAMPCECRPIQTEAAWRDRKTNSEREGA